MNDDRLLSLWRGASEDVEVRVNGEQLLASLERAGAFHRRLRRGDTLDFLGGLALLAILALTAWQRPGFLASITTGGWVWLAVVVAAWIGYQVLARRARPLEPAVDSTLVDVLEAERLAVLRRQHLLTWIVWATIGELSLAPWAILTLSLEFAVRAFLCALVLSISLVVVTLAQRARRRQAAPLLGTLTEALAGLRQP